MFGPIVLESQRPDGLEVRLSDKLHQVDEKVIGHLIVEGFGEQEGAVLLFGPDFELANS
jgi:hypothetical protein